MHGLGDPDAPVDRGRRRLSAGNPSRPGLRSPKNRSRADSTSLPTYPRPPARHARHARGGWVIRSTRFGGFPGRRPAECEQCSLDSRKALVDSLRAVKPLAVIGPEMRRYGPFCGAVERPAGGFACGVHLRIHPDNQGGGLDFVTDREYGRLRWLNCPAETQEIDCDR